MAPGIAAGLIVLGILLGQNVVGNNADALKLAAIIVTNTVYEAFLMFLIAYALIEYPRSIWSQSDLDQYLQQTQNKAAAEFKDISDTKLEVSLVVASVLKTKTQVRFDIHFLLSFLFVFKMYVLYVVLPTYS